MIFSISRVCIVKLSFNVFKKNVTIYVLHSLSYYFFLYRLVKQTLDSYELN